MMDARLVDSGGVRRFSDARIQAAIDSALASVKPESKVAVVVHHTYAYPGGVAGENRTTATLLVRLPQGFSVAAAGYKDWTSGEIGGEAQLVWEI